MIKKNILIVFITTLCLSKVAYGQAEDSLLTHALTLSKIANGPESLYVVQYLLVPWDTVRYDSVLRIARIEEQRIADSVRADNTSKGIFVKTGESSSSNPLNSIPELLVDHIIEQLKEEGELIALEGIKSLLTDPKHPIWGQLFPNTRKRLSTSDDITYFVPVGEFLLEPIREDLDSLVIRASDQLLEDPARSIIKGFYPVLISLQRHTDRGVIDQLFINGLKGVKIDSMIMTCLAFGVAMSDELYYKQDFRKLNSNEKARTIFFSLLLSRAGASQGFFDNLAKVKSDFADPAGKAFSKVEKNFNQVILTVSNGAKEFSQLENKWRSMGNSPDSIIPKLDILNQFLDGWLTQIETGCQLLDLSDTNLTNALESIRSIARNAKMFAIAVEEKKYQVAISAAEGMIIENINSSVINDEHFHKMIRLINFGAAIADAKNSTDLSAAIDGFAEPVGGYRIKRKQASFTINTYAGFNGGGEMLLDNSASWSGQFGLWMPVGVEYSVPLCGEGTSGGSIGIFLQLLDLGALGSFRLSSSTAINDTTSVSNNPSVTLAEVFSPGVFGTIGLSSEFPLSFTFGGELTPQLRNVTQNGITTATPALRLSAGFSFDLPLFIF